MLKCQRSICQGQGEKVGQACVVYYFHADLVSYVASLESRVEKLERRINYARSRKASVAMHDADEPVAPPDRKDSLATIRAAIHGKAARRREAADVNELVSDFGFLSVKPSIPLYSS